MCILSFNTEQESKCRRKIHLYYNGQNLRGEIDYVQLSRKRDGSGKHTGYMALEAVWILNSRTEVEVGGFLGRGNRISNALVAGKIWGVQGEEQRVKSDGTLNLKLGSHGLQTEKMGKIQFSKALNADLKKLHLFLQTVERHIGLLSNYLIVFSFTSLF